MYPTLLSQLILEKPLSSSKAFRYSGPWHLDVPRQPEHQAIDSLLHIEGRSMAHLHIELCGIHLLKLYQCFTTILLLLGSAIIGSPIMESPVLRPLLMRSVTIVSRVTQIM